MSQKNRKLADARDALYREHVLDAAEAVFARHGYDNAKMADVAAEAGVSLSTVYTLFDGKQGLFVAIQERHSTALLELGAKAVIGRTDPLDVLLLGGESYVRYMLAHPSFLAMHLRDGHSWFTPGGLRSPEQQSQFERGIEMLAGVFRAGIDRGVFADDDPEVMARGMVALDQMRLQAWVDAGGAGSEDDLVRALQAQRVRAFCTPEVAATRLDQSGALLEDR
jgi:AcrR family transcriptional regulator